MPTAPTVRLRSGNSQAEGSEAGVHATSVHTAGNVDGFRAPDVRAPDVRAPDVHTVHAHPAAGALTDGAGVAVEGGGSREAIRTEVDDGDASTEGTCLVCLEPLGVAGRACSYQCGHIFCSGCDAQLEGLGDHRCPTCRAPRIGYSVSAAEQAAAARFAPDTSRDRAIAEQHAARGAREADDGT